MTQGEKKLPHEYYTLDLPPPPPPPQSFYTGGGGGNDVWGDYKRNSSGKVTQPKLAEDVTPEIRRLLGLSMWAPNVVFLHSSDYRNYPGYESDGIHEGWTLKMKQVVKMFEDNGIPTLSMNGFIRRLKEAGELMGPTLNEERWGEASLG